MNSLALVRAHARIEFLDLLRSPGYVVPTVVFPAMFFVLFDLAVRANAAPISRTSTSLAFIAFAIVGVTLYQFGVGIAQERGRPWERYLRTLPVSAAARFAARIVTAVLFGLLTAASVALVARALTPIDLDAVQWLRVLLYALRGGVPFVLIGITIGYWVSARAAVPIATACNLLLAYAGGLWMPPADLPAFVATISPFLPTRAVRRSPLERHRGRRRVPGSPALAIYTAIFAALAAIGYRGDERTRYA